MIKPSHYDNDGYVVQWLRSTMPSNSLAAVFSLAKGAEEFTNFLEAEHASAAARMGLDIDVPSGLSQGMQVAVQVIDEPGRCELSLLDPSTKPRAVAAKAR